MAADRLLLDETRPTIAAIAAMNRKDHEGIDLIFNGVGKPITSAASKPISRKVKMSGPPIWCSRPAISDCQCNRQ